MQSFHDELKKLMDEFAHDIYRITRTFPKYELYGLTSQLRRACVSIVLNFIEGYARFTLRQKLQFFRISHGSFQETVYLIRFCFEEGMIEKDDFERLQTKSQKIGKMLWGTLKGVESKIDS